MRFVFSMMSRPGRNATSSRFDVEVVHGDIGDGTVVKKALAGDRHRGPSRGGYAGHGLDRKSGEKLSHERSRHVQLLCRMREAGVTRIVNASTGGAILGEIEPPAHEEIAAAPLAPYGASKLAAEGYCSAFAGAYGFSATSLRFSNVYGPRSYNKGSVVAHFFKRILAERSLSSTATARRRAIMFS